MDFYTYIYQDRQKGEPFYVGKGCNERAWDHLKSNRKSEFIYRIKKMIRESNPPIISIYSGFDNELACLVEQELISKFGRKNLGLGPLLNLTDGGEGAPNRLSTPEFRANMSKAKKGQKYSALASENFRRAMIGRIYTAERNANVSIGLKGHLVSEETRLKIGAKSKINSAGENNGMFGKQQTEETKQKIGEKVRAAAQAKRTLIAGAHQ